MPLKKCILKFSLVLLLGLVLAGCAQSAAYCPTIPKPDLSQLGSYAGDNSLPFQFPLDPLDIGDEVDYYYFCMHQDYVENPKYHAAEDFGREPGTPVYAIADGVISFSGPMEGYGWLVIIDHPQFNLYSLYGHLSPSRWRMESGEVQKGDLIAYIGDSHENGGSYKQPLIPHLYLGLRAGQRSDYPGKGEWRWQAGWIHPCPTDLGWLQPTSVITQQIIPEGGFLAPTGHFLERWGVELMLSSIYFIGGAFMLIFALKKKTHVPLIFFGALLSVAGWYFNQRGFILGYALYLEAGLFIGIGVTLYIRRRADAERLIEP